AFRTFEAQSEVDYFINKNAKEFLQEQFKLWLYQYVYSEETEWPKERIDQLQILKNIAYKIIDFISQFEDELVKIWNKPKFVKNSNYVITLDRIKDLKFIEKIIDHKNINEQIKEWQELGIIDENFKTSDVFETDLTGKHLSKKYEHLPIDTKYFKDLEIEILSLFDDLDN
ncbi:MAG: site-specific DNA-methyltransferase, partial [bacterium]